MSNNIDADFYIFIKLCNFCLHEKFYPAHVKVSRSIFKKENGIHIQIRGHILILPNEYLSSKKIVVKLDNNWRPLCHPTGMYRGQSRSHRKILSFNLCATKNQHSQIQHHIDTERCLDSTCRGLCECHVKTLRCNSWW